MKKAIGKYPEDVRQLHAEMAYKATLEGISIVKYSENIDISSSTISYWVEQYRIENGIMSPEEIKEDHVKKYLAAYAKTKMKQKDYAKENNLKVSLLSKWIKKYKAEKKPNVDDVFKTVTDEFNSMSEEWVFYNQSGDQLPVLVASNLTGEEKLKEGLRQLGFMKKCDTESVLDKLNGKV